MFDPITLKLNIDPLLEMALKEDITEEDLSTSCIIRKAKLGRAVLLAKEEGILSGIQIFSRVFELIDPQTEIHLYQRDADPIRPGMVLGELKGDIRVLLGGERTALNYIQRMSGIASYARSMVRILDGTSIKLVDTRKTTPNNRIFEKYAVRTGGASNHRFNLSDGILLKDNHVAVAGGIREAIQMAKSYAPFVHKIEIETENLDEVREALAAKADIIMLDNMEKEMIQQAIRLIDGKALIEISGNITLANLEMYKDLAVNFISSGALTHSAPSLDLSLNLDPIQ